MREARSLRHFIGPWASAQQGNRRRRVHDDDRGASVPLRIARHESIAPRAFSGGGADRILEIAPGQGQRPSKDGAIDRGHVGNGQKVAHDPTRKGGIALAGRQIEDRRDAVRGDDGFELLPLRRSPESARGLAERRPVEDEVEDDVHVEKDPLQRYFRPR